MNDLSKRYQQEIVPQLKKELKEDNLFAVPKLKKIVINSSLKDPQDPKARLKALENLAVQFGQITGQKAMITTAKKAISGFKLRAGDPLGVKVTLRGDRMWQFLTKLISVALPRVKDFRGVSRKAFDGQGNYSMGLEEQIIFPEISYDQIDSIRGMQIGFVTSAQTNEAAFRLLELLGIPFEKEAA
ncbi:MAG: 50S ribosomal protein L5 [Candidatus Pacebacteria bacterium CG_4_10_14_0_8_um_filter_43_12]|nr:MAG: 50S ribosomal protein L5 [Candidatus Pacebacteria bacterium CG10_big_fil_rev_8_21_14_0_10_44_11]PIY79546.1 MAG: 50S ribosomal protein L5 [Candidatus Pacebacteria bacterium CG_4_10_14_0_8_um_filter_43_12]